MPPTLKLTHVHRVSEKTVLLTAGDNKALDFATINSCPPAHRGMVQKNGLIAKVWLTVSEKGLSAAEQKSIFTAGTESVPIWKEALVQSQLSNKGTNYVPASSTTIPWPVLHEEEYQLRKRFIEARQICESVDTSSFCVPVCSVQNFSLKVKKYSVNLCVVWMPFFQKDAVAWSEEFVNKKKAVPRVYLTRLVTHVSSALRAWHKIILNTETSEIRGCPDTLEIDDIFVYENDGEPTFAVSTSFMSNKSKIETAIALKSKGYSQLAYFPYLAPEQVKPSGYVIKDPTYDVWAIGMILFNIATGVPSLKAYLSRFNDRKVKTLPFNHPDATPDGIIKVIRTDLEQSSYGADMISLIALLLAQDYRCRPSIRTVEHMMMELDRSSPIIRFPFSLGSFDLLRLNDCDEVEVNLSARKYVTKDLCILCNEVRKLVKCTYGNGTHAPAITSSSWTEDELLPGIIRAPLSMSYLYPLVPPLEDKDRRKYTSTGLGAETESVDHGFRASGFHNPNDKMDIAQLFQLFGGFAVHEQASQGEKRANIREIFTLLPCSTLRKNEATMSEGTISFTGAMPWLSQCTAMLQKRGTLCKSVPFNFVGTNSTVQWFAWILPGESFTLSNGHVWVPAPEGGFVFLFSESLKPHELDRYFTLTSISALTNKYKLENSTLVDKVFKRHAEAGDSAKSANRSMGNSRSNIMDNSAGDPASVTRRKRSTRNTSAVDIPTTAEEIIETDQNVAPRRSVTEPKGAPAKPTNPPRAPSANRNRRSTSHAVGVIPDNDAKKISSAHSDRRTSNTMDRKRTNTMPNAQSMTTAITTNDPFRPLGMQDDYVNISIQSHSNVPRLPSIDGNGKMPTMYVYGKLNSASGIDAVFQSLTFWIPQTGEHGMMQESIPISKEVRSVLQAPKDATYMSFLSNEVPLFGRNHGGCNVPLSTLIMPHHGFIFYNDNEAPVGLLSLLCSSKVIKPRKGEFRIPLKALPPNTFPVTDTRNFYPSYISDEILTLDKNADQSTTFLMSDLFHTQSLVGKNSLSNQRAMKGNGTDDAAICWVGFDLQNVALVFSNVYQDVWYPYALC